MESFAIIEFYLGFLYGIVGLIAGLLVAVLCSIVCFGLKSLKEKLQNRRKDSDEAAADLDKPAKPATTVSE